MKTYRRRFGRDVWHFMQSCRWWPKSEYQLRTGKPKSGELCNECIAKSKRTK